MPTKSRLGGLENTVAELLELRQSRVLDVSDCCILPAHTIPEASAYRRADLGALLADTRPRCQEPRPAESAELRGRDELVEA
jgi:hypothetical protein